MPYPRDMTPIERQDVAGKLAKLASDGSIDPRDILDALEIGVASFNLNQAPTAVWRQVVDNTHAGRSTAAGSGVDAIARLLETMSVHLPGRAELRDMAFRLAGTRRVPHGGNGATTQSIRQLFLSYSSLDRVDVDKLHDELKREHPTIEMFQDHRMAPGTRWYDAIYDAATGSSAMVCWATDSYLKSTFCAFEIGLATVSGVPLLPIFSPPELTGGLLPAYIGSTQGINGVPSQSIPEIINAMRLG